MERKKKKTGRRNRE